MTGVFALTVVSSRVFQKRLDFRMDVAHGLASRFYSDNIYVEIRSGSGETGYGECVPRSYVTGETPESVRAVLPELIASVASGTFSSPGEIVACLETAGISELGAKNPAAFCALELALLDLAGRHWEIPVSDVLGLAKSPAPLIYSLVVPLLPDAALETFMEYAAGFEFRQVKVKVDNHDPVGHLRKVKSLLAPGAEIRIDANCAWMESDAPDFTRAMASEGVVSVEQPLPAEDLDGMAKLRGEGVLITLDESVCGPGDVDRAVNAGACDMINVRISKCGGLLGALRVMDAARRNGLSIQLGAQVGESCILSAAGALLAGSTPSFRWREGCFGTHLLREDLCEGDFRFGPHGNLVPPFGPGLGVTVSRSRLYPEFRP